MTNISTNTKPTWCPGCWNFQILAGVKNYLEKKIKTEADKKKYAIVAGIGCNSKIFDYLNLNGINTLHGRVLPTMLGMKIGKPDLNLIGFSGDGGGLGDSLTRRPRSRSVLVGSVISCGIVLVIGGGDLRSSGAGDVREIFPRTGS